MSERIPYPDEVVLHQRGTGCHDLLNNFPLLEIHNHEALETGQVHEDPLGRAVRIGLESHRTHSLFHDFRPQRPGDLIGGCIDDRKRPRANHPSGDVSAIRGREGVVYAPHRGNGLYDLIGIHIDDLDHRRPGDRGIDLAGRATGGDVVGPGSQRDAFDDFEAAGIDDVDADVVFVGHVVFAAFRVNGNSMGQAQTFNDADDFLR